MDETITFITDRATARRALTQWVWTQSGTVLVLVLVVVGVLAWFAVAGDGSRLAAFGLGLAVCPLLLVAVSFSRTTKTADDYAGAPASWRVGDGGISTSSSIGSGTSTWQGIRAVVLTRDFVFLRLRGGRGLKVAPRASFHPATLAFVAEHVRTAGGTVKGEVRRQQETGPADRT